MRRKVNVKLVGSVLAGLLVAGVAVHFLHGYQVQRNAYLLRERAEQAAEAKDDDKALIYYAQYLSFVPGDIDAQQKYVEALDRRTGVDGDIVDLTLKMEQVLRAKPNQHELRFRLVHNLMAIERYGDAIDNLKKLQSAWPDQAVVLHTIAWCYDAKNDTAKSIDAFEQAIRANPKQVKSYALLAEVLRDRADQPDEAQKVLDDLVRANADSYQAYLVRGRFLRRRGDDKAAQDDLSTALKLGPNVPEVILELADSARARGDWSEAVKLLQDGLKRFPERADFFKAMASVKISSENRDEAIAHLRKAPKSIDVTILLVDLLIDQKQYAEARAKIDELVKADVRQALANYLRARLAMADKDWNEAIRLLESARKELGAGTEWSSRINLLLGVGYRAIGDRDQELQAFRRAVRDEPTWTTASIGLGAALLDNGRVEEACQTLEPLTTAKDVPAGYWPLLGRARLERQMRLADADRSWESVEEVLARADAKSVEAALLKADMFALRNDFAAAALVLEKARVEHPDEITLTCALADLGARQNRVADAEKLLEKAGDRIEVRLAQCRLWGSGATAANKEKLQRLGDVRGTTFTLDERVRLWRELADTWHRLSDWKRAESTWREIARALPKDLRSRTALFDLSLQRNQAAAARGWLTELRNIEGEQGVMWRYCDAALIVQESRGRPQPLAEARKKLQEIEAIHKNWPRAAVLSGVIHELEGKSRQAIDDYARALELGELQPRVLASLLALFIKHGEFNKAETELARYEQKVPLTAELARTGAEVALKMRDRRYARVAVRRGEQAVTPQPRDYRDALWLAGIYQAADENAKAEALLVGCLDQAGHSPETWIAWMEFCEHNNQRERGVKDLDRLKKALPASRHALTIAQCYEALHLPDQANKAYQDALKQAPEDFLVLSYAADFARRADDRNQARNLYERLIESDTGAPVEDVTAARRHLAVLLAASAPTEALAYLAMNKNTVADQRIRWFIQAQSASGRKEALAKFEESLRIQAATPDERLLLARILELNAKLGDARTQLNELVDEHPTSPYFLAAYAGILVRMQEFDDAGRIVTRLEALEPNSPRVRDLRSALNQAKQP